MSASAVEIKPTADGRLGIYLDGKSSGFYAWFESDAQEIMFALAIYFRDQQKAEVDED